MARTATIGASLGLAAVALCGACALTPPSQTPAPASDLTATAQAAAESYDRQAWTEAESHYLVLARELPEDTEPWFRLGNIYARTNRPTLAINAYREALIREPANARAWHNMGIVQLREAAASFEEMEKFIPHDDPLYARTQELREAIEAMLKGE
jgi:cytochrome c-type biogenesis protein CcmH/NrfG